MTIEEILNNIELERYDSAEIDKLATAYKKVKAKLDLYKDTLHDNHVLIKKLNDIEEELEYMSTDAFIDEEYDIKEKYWNKLKKIINREV